MGLKLLAQFLNEMLPKLHTKTLNDIGSKGEPIATPSH